MHTPLLGWKDCQRPHNAEFATGSVITNNWLERIMLITAIICFIGVAAINVGWL